ncbi:MAG: hypothetical protein GY858_09460 [Candidatus Omnitrophica bacterium]|nr:hypothetical protein [Candidatus Omnitrophota bacterium]
MKTIAKTRLQIRDQNELINQISGTYKDFYRAAMEYIDNSIDAASMPEFQSKRMVPRIEIHIDADKKTVSFTDNCAGMAPDELCELLSSVGRSRKKAVAWANGQFGFGVHAFRAFAKDAVFISRKKGCKEAVIKIDRTVDERKDVHCYENSKNELTDCGTRVTISRFDPHVFKKSSFAIALAGEIEHHFDDVLRAKRIRIFINEKGKKHYECKYFDYSKLVGPELKRSVNFDNDESGISVEVDLKVLDKAQENRLPVLTNKRRRIQSISDLKSFKNYLRLHGDISYVWTNPFVVGSIEINNVCSPNLTRDDLKDSVNREKLYEILREVQTDLKILIDDAMNKKTQESFKKISKIMSDCLSQILQKFKLEFEQLVPSGEPGTYNEKPNSQDGDVPFGGEDVPGGGGEGANGTGSGGSISDAGQSGPGDSNTSGGSGAGQASSTSGSSNEKVITSPGPKIEFQNHAGEDRVIDLGNSLIVNTQHPDFISRNVNKTGRVKFDVRLLSYVSQIISPYCVHRLFEKRGRVPSVSEVADNVVNLSLKVENVLVGTLLGEEMDIG